MAKAKGRLLASLAVEKGVDYKKVVEKRKQKEARREKRKAGIAVDDKPQPAKKQKKEEKPADSEESEDSEDYEDVEDGEEDSEEEDDDYDMAELLDREAVESDDEEDEDDEDEGIDLSKFEHDESSSDSEVEMEEKIERPKKAKQSDTPQLKSALKKTRKADPQESDSEEEEEEEDIDMEDIDDELDDEEREDLVPYVRTTINNHTALLAALNRIGMPTGPGVPFATHQSVISSKPTTESIPDIQDDLQRELAFYAQALEAAKIGRSALLKEGVPFTRPNDYFAEMVKSDGQMEKVKAKLVEEATNKKAAAEARKQRDLKKFGKQVQVAKEQERAKAKRETLEKIKTLKKKRAEGSASALGATEADDLFDVAVDNEIKAHDKRTASAGKKRPGAPSGAPNAKRQKKDAKYGFGGKKRHSKSGDAVSSGDLSGFSVKRMKSGGKGGAKPRLGKSRRNAGGGKR
jgi:rRNA-processing protein EBP2